MPNKGIDQLRMALEPYEKWVAMKKVEKVEDLQCMIDIVKRLLTVSRAASGGRKHGGRVM